MQREVKLGEFAVERSPYKLIAKAIGSGVGVMLYDLELKIGGPAYIMLPSGNDPGAKYADSGLRNMLDEIKRRLDKLFEFELSDSKKSAGITIYYFPDQKVLPKILRAVEV